MCEGQTRQRVLMPSRSGSFYAVVELHQDAQGRLEAFEVSGYRLPSRAGRLRARLEREGRWLSESSKEAMRTGQTLRVSALEWQPWP